MGVMITDARGLYPPAEERAVADLSAKPHQGATEVSKLKLTLYNSDLHERACQ